MQKTGFFLAFGRFGAGKTQHITRMLSGSRSFMDKLTFNYWPKRSLKITNYSTGYSHVQIQSTEDLVNVLNDIADYHEAYRCYDRFKFIFRLYPKKIRDEKLARVLAIREKYGDLPKDYYFQIATDEVGVWFNARNFAKNFNGKNERLLEFITQPRKIKTLWYCTVQNPALPDVNFMRLAQTLRFIYKGFGFLGWYKDFYFMGDDFSQVQAAECVGWGFNWNLYPLVKLEYDTEQLVVPSESIYEPGRVFELIRHGVGDGETDSSLDYETLVPQDPEEEVEGASSGGAFQLSSPSAGLPA